MWRITGGNIDGVDGKTAFDAMRQGDDASGVVVNNYVGRIACGIANIVNIFQPEIVLIGGGICKEGDMLLAPLRALVAKDSFGGVTCKLGVCLLGNDAGIIGAACLWDGGGR
jgi:glucokinase